MTYATPMDLIDLFGEVELTDLTDRADPPMGVVNLRVAQDAIDDAAAMIDGYLAKRYALPLPTVPPMLRAMACDIARYRLHTRLAPTDAVRANYDDALRRLRDIAAGVLELPVPGAAIATSVPDLPAASNPARIFTDATLKDFTR